MMDVEVSMAEFKRAGAVTRFVEGRGRLVEIEGTKVAVFRRGRRFHAFSDACPHMGASLADGRLEGEQIECHWHGWKYDLASGRSDAREWACIAIYETRVQDGELWIAIPPEMEPAATPEPEPKEEWFKWDPEQNRKIED